jgi:predicted alpha/beta-fold hydrolase
LTKKLIEKMNFNSKAVELYVEQNGVLDFDIDKLKFLRTTFQFDDLYTFKILSRNNTPAVYYQNVSCIQKIKDVNIPVLFLHSKNDPICLYCLVLFSKL